MIRSFLFVPADSERKLAKAADAGADALIVDLEDAVAADARPAARAQAREFVADNPAAWVRINPLSTDDAIADLEAVVPMAPEGIVLPKPAAAASVDELAAMLDRLESAHGLAPGRTQILPIVTEQPAALLAMQSYLNCSSRLAGLTWGAEDLAAALGARSKRDADGDWLPIYEMARSLCRLTAAAAQVPAYDTIFADFRDGDGLAARAAAAARDGFAGMLAIHPAQVAIINAAFSPDAEEIAAAQRVIALFRDNPGTGALSLDGKMLDRPHLVNAERVLERAAVFQGKDKKAGDD